MADTYSARLTKQQQNALEQMAAGDDADNKSEALRTALNAGLAELGYRNGHKQDTALRAVLQRLGDAFGLTALVWVGLTFLYPLGFRMFAIPIFVVGVGFHLADRAAERYEPHVSEWLVGGGERA